VGNTRGNAENFTSFINDVEHKLFDRLPTKPGSTPATAKTPPLAPNVPRSPNGAPAAVAQDSLRQRLY
jgi:hypothetical protein